MNPHKGLLVRLDEEGNIVHAVVNIIQKENENRPIGSVKLTPDKKFKKLARRV